MKIVHTFDVSKLDTSKVIAMNGMFGLAGENVITFNIVGLDKIEK